MNAQTKIIAGQQSPVETLHSDDLFGNASVLNIDHQGMTYTLRITRQGKLLLTK